MFKSIVVGTDGSPTANEAVQKAAGLARMCDATLHLVMAYRPLSELVLNPEALPVDLANLVNPQEDAQSICKEVANRLKAEGLNVETHSAAGKAADALVDTAEKVDADLIVVGNRGMKGARRILGSVPNSVAHHAPCTVMIVQTCD